MIRHLCPASLIRSSCTLGPIDGMGREAGIPNASPSWISRSRVPASKRPSDVKGGLLIEPCKKTDGYREGPVLITDLCPIGHRSSRLDRTRPAAWRAEPEVSASMKEKGSARPASACG